MLNPAISVWALAAAGAGAGLWHYGALSPGSQLFGRHLTPGRNPQEVALTYDDGPNGDTTLRLIDVLGPTPAAFFLIGNYVKQQPDVVRRLAEAGHVLGNHTMTHPVLTWQSKTRIREELAGCNAAIEDVTGAAVRYFRPPHGARRPSVMRIAQELGLTPVLWNSTGYDWTAIPSGEIVSNAVRDIYANRRRGTGSDVLLHDGGQFGLGQKRDATLDATAEMLSLLPSRGMRFVSLDHWQLAEQRAK